MRHRQAPLVVRSRQMRVAGIARTEWVCLGPGAVRWPRVQASFDIDRWRGPPRATITSQLASPACGQVMSPQGHGLQAFPSLYRVRTQGRGARPPARSINWTRPPGRWSDAGRSTAPAPQSKPVAHASRLVAQGAPSVALGLGVRILAAGPAHVRLYSDCRRYVNDSSKICWSSSAGAGIG